MTTLPASSELCLDRGETVDVRQTPGALWQVEEGLLLIQGPVDSGAGGWRLAMPGDWLALEDACGFGSAGPGTALVSSRLRAVPEAQQMSSDSLLRRLILQQQRWAGHLMALRSGPVELRIRHLLGLVRQAVGHRRASEPNALPILRDVAMLVDAAPETACRVLTRLKPRRNKPADRAAAPSRAPRIQAPMGAALA